MKRHILLFTLSFLLAQAVEAVPRTPAAIRSAALQVLNTARSGKHRAAGNAPLELLKKTDIISVMGYKEGGFAIIANDDLMPEVLAVGDTPFTGESNENLAWWLRCIDAVGRECVATGKAPRRVPAPDPAVYPEYVDALVSAEWGQEAPYWNLCPMEGSRRCLTGCVATALAQVLYINRYPQTGIGSRTISVNGTSVSADFGDTVYDYACMLDNYLGDYTPEQAEAVATLMLHCGVAANMQYSPDGSGAYTNQAADGMRKYFGIDTALYLDRSGYSDADWMEIIYEELAAGHPMYYSGVDPSPWTGGGHAFVCDGYDADGRVHINWGWDGSDNGYYNIDLLNPSGYSFKMYQDVIIGLYDPDGTVASELITLDIETDGPGHMAELITADNMPVLKGITVRGAVNSDDLALLKLLASGGDLSEMGVEGNGRLSAIDLSDALLEDDEMGDDAFRDCRLLRTVKLPRSLTRIGSHAFAGCTHLRNIHSYTFNVPKTGSRCFDGVEASYVTLHLIAGSSDYYRRNAQWKTIVTANNIREFGTCIKARNYSRQYGEPNPVFGFQLFGERVTGSPVIWTDATSETAPGKYAINISQGTVDDAENLVLVPGTLTIKESDASGIDGVTTDATTSNVYGLDATRAKNVKKNRVYITNGKKILQE